MNVNMLTDNVKLMLYLQRSSVFLLGGTINGWLGNVQSHSSIIHFSSSPAETKAIIMHEICISGSHDRHDLVWPPVTSASNTSLINKSQQNM